MLYILYPTTHTVQDMLYTLYLQYLYHVPTILLFIFIVRTIQDVSVILYILYHKHYTLLYTHFDRDPLVLGAVRYLALLLIYTLYKTVHSVQHMLLVRYGVCSGIYFVECVW